MQPKQDDSSDVTLVLKDGKEIRATRNQLSESDFFSTLLNSDMKENREGIIRLEHITETVMKDVLKFMRCGCVIITQQNAVNLLEAADYLLLPSLKKCVERFLERELTTSNCVSTYYYAEKYQCKDLMVISRNFFFPNFAAVAQSQEFLNLESEQVERWICSDRIGDSTLEDDVFKVILQWIEQSKSERKGNFQELFRHVRLPFMSRDYLYRHVVTNDLVKENPSCLKEVKQTLKNSRYRRGYHRRPHRKWSEYEEELPGLLILAGICSGSRCTII